MKGVVFVFLILRFLRGEINLGILLEGWAGSVLNSVLKPIPG